MPKDIRERLQERTDALSERIYRKMRQRVVQAIRDHELALDKIYEQVAADMRKDLAGLIRHTHAAVESSLRRNLEHRLDERIEVIRQQIEAGAKAGAEGSKDLFEAVFGEKGPKTERPFVEVLTSKSRPMLRLLRPPASAAKRQSTD